MKNRKSLSTLLIGFLALLIVIWFIRTQIRPSGKSSPANSESVAAHFGPADIYPDPARTPGAINPDIAQENIRETICNPRWSTKSIRRARGQQGARRDCDSTDHQKFCSHRNLHAVRAVRVPTSGER